MRLAPWTMLRPSSKFMADASFVEFFFIFVLSLSYCLVCFLQPCGHLLGKGWPLGSLVCDVFICFCHFPIQRPVSGMILDSISSWYLPSSLLCNEEDGHIISSTQILTLVCGPRAQHLRLVEGKCQGYWIAFPGFLKFLFTIKNDLIEF